MKYGERVLLKQFKNGNKLWGIATRCVKCGGYGKLGWTSYADGVCFDCDGKGWYFEEERELTPENLAKREAKLAKERAKAEAERAEREAERAKREAAWKAEQEEFERVRRGHYYGEVGQKVEIEVKYTGCSSYETIYGWTTVYRFDTDDGAHLVWKTSGSLGGENLQILEDNRLTIKATIKDHKEYKGIEQTELQRGKVVKGGVKMCHVATTPEEWKEVEKAQKTMSNDEYDRWIRKLYIKKNEEEVAKIMEAI